MRSKKGFAQVVKEGKVTALEEIDTGDEFELESPNAVLKAKALSKRVL